MTKSYLTGILAVTLRELDRMRSRVLYPIVLLVLPIVSFLLFAAMLIHGVPRDLPIAVLDSDHTALSRKLVSMIDALPSIRVSYNANDMHDGKELMARGKAFAFVVIPEHFERDLNTLRAPRVINYFNNQYLLIGGTIQREIYSAVRTLSAGASIQTRMKKGEPAAMARISIQPIEIQSHVLFNPNTNYLYYLASSLLPNMLHIFVILSAIFCFGVELKERTMPDLIETAGGSVPAAIIGKFAPYFVIFLIMGIFMQTLLFTYLGAPMRGNLPLLMVATALMIIAYQSVGVVFISITANLRLGLMGASFYASTAYTFIGMTFPIIAFPLPARIWAECIPLTHYMRIYIDQAVMGAAVPLSIRSCVALVLFILLPFALSWRISRVMRDDSFLGGV